ncbi:MAG: hypothetical protein J07HQX50_02392 [Haloquadratum sp. J07HQX50]|nr:MAG: hypothetical protein J07HQX50_02392 [Haloquadratum sp. J07HQX50]
MYCYTFGTKNDTVDLLVGESLFLLAVYATSVNWKLLSLLSSVLSSLPP